LQQSSETSKTGYSLVPHGSGKFNGEFQHDCYIQGFGGIKAGTKIACQANFHHGQMNDIQNLDPEFEYSEGHLTIDDLFRYIGGFKDGQRSGVGKEFLFSACGVGYLKRDGLWANDKFKQGKWYYEENLSYCCEILDYEPQPDLIKVDHLSCSVRNIKLSGIS
jgi:hypothetical protein